MHNEECGSLEDSEGVHIADSSSGPMDAFKNCTCEMVCVRVTLMGWMTDEMHNNLTNMANLQALLNSLTKDVSDG